MFFIKIAWQVTHGFHARDSRKNNTASSKTTLGSSSFDRKNLEKTSLDCLLWDDNALLISRQIYVEHFK